MLQMRGNIYPQSIMITAANYYFLTVECALVCVEEGRENMLEISMLP